MDVSERTFKATKLFQGNGYLFRVTAENRVGLGEPAQTEKPTIAKLPYGESIRGFSIVYCLSLVKAPALC